MLNEPYYRTQLSSRRAKFSTNIRLGATSRSGLMLEHSPILTLHWNVFVSEGRTARITVIMST